MKIISYRLFVTEENDYYKIVINFSEREKRPTARIVIGIILILLLISLIIGIIVLSVPGPAISSSINFNVKKNDWENSLNHQLAINNLGPKTKEIKSKLIRRINSLNSSIDDKQKI